MKIRLCVLLFILSAFSAVSGQQYSIGIKPGFLITSAKFTVEPEVIGLTLSSRGSYAFGFTFRDQINKLTGIKIEPGIKAKGYNISQGEGNEDIYRNSYLSVPILFYISPIQNLNLEIGPDISCLFDSKVKMSGSKTFQTTDFPNQRTLEFSLLTGISYSFLKKT